MVKIDANFVSQPQNFLKIREQVATGKTTLDSVRKAIETRLESPATQAVVNVLKENLNAAIKGKREYYTHSKTAKAIHQIAVLTIFGGKNGETKAMYKAKELSQTIYSRALIKVPSSRKKRSQRRSQRDASKGISAILTKFKPASAEIIEKSADMDRTELEKAHDTKQLSGVLRKCYGDLQGSSLEQFMRNGTIPEGKKLEFPPGVAALDGLFFVRFTAQRLIEEGENNSSLKTTLQGVVKKYNNAKVADKDQAKWVKNEIVKIEGQIEQLSNPSKKKVSAPSSSPLPALKREKISKAAKEVKTDKKSDELVYLRRRRKTEVKENLLPPSTIEKEQGMEGLFKKRSQNAVREIDVNAPSKRKRKKIKKKRTKSRTSPQENVDTSSVKRFPSTTSTRSDMTIPERKDNGEK